jgi:hypothetical protein
MFWTSPVAGLEDWFRQPAAHGCPAGGGAVRIDEYLRAPGQVELGIKRRGKKKGIEVKGLVHVDWSGVQAAPFLGPIEIWTKWSSEHLDLGSAATVVTQKRRWLRKFDTAGGAVTELPLDADEKPLSDRPLPGFGCNVELTHVKLAGGEEGWTLGFESFGSLTTVSNDLRAAASLLAGRRPPPLPAGSLLGYPAWLSQREPGADGPRTG